MRRALLALLALALASPAGASSSQYEVKRGENLATIASRTLGDARLWPALYAANRDRIKDPTRVYPGQLLSIPALTEGEREAARREAAARPLGEPEVGAGSVD